MTKRYSIFLSDEMVKFLKEFAKVIGAKKIQTAIKVILDLYKKNNS